MIGECTQHLGKLTEADQRRHAEICRACRIYVGMFPPLY